MRAPDNVFDVFLQPGELYFGNRGTRIRTVLGSCVSLVFWHPGMCVGGMCHFMLPSRGRPAPGAPLDGRYGDEALALLTREIDMLGAPRAQYVVKVFGGGNMFTRIDAREESSVGLRNVRAARDLLAQNGFKIAVENLGGAGHRNVVFEVWSGDVWLKHVSIPGQVQPPPPFHNHSDEALSLCGGSAGAAGAQLGA